MPHRIYSPTEKVGPTCVLGLRNGNFGGGHPLMELPRFQPGHPPKVANFANKQGWQLPVSPIGMGSLLCMLCVSAVK